MPIKKRCNEHRANETADEANARLQNERLRINEHRANETADEVNARRQNNRLRHDQHRDNEPAHDANALRACDLENHNRVNRAQNYSPFTIGMLFYIPVITNSRNIINYT